MNTVAEPPGPDNPHANAFYAEATPLKSELSAQRVVDPLKGRYWVVSNPSVKNALGQPVAYKLMPGENVLPFADPSASIMQRAGFMAKHLWVTPYASDETSATGPYPNQHPGGAGLPEYTRERPQRGEHRPGFVVHPGLPPRPAPGGLAHIARILLRVQPEAGGLLRHQPGAGRAAQRPPQRPRLPRLTRRK